MVVRAGWTTERREEVRRLRERGFPWVEIAAQLGVTPDSARAAWRALAEQPTEGAEPEARVYVPSIKPPNLDQPPTRPVRTRAEGYLVISDLQIPFEHDGALVFCERVRREFAIPRENVLCVGDELDLYFGSLYSHNPDATHTPNSELADAKDRLRAWFDVFPQMRLCTSNHGDRWRKKAANAQIPEQLLRSYRDVIGAPDGWRWARRWDVDGSKMRFRVEHGHEGPGGYAGLRQRPLHNSMATVWGHTHSLAGVMPIETFGGLRLWGMNVGCLIDRDAYAFHYNKPDTWRPVLGVGVVLDGGTIPVFVPFEG